MTTTFDVLSKDELLQQYWIKRFMAALIDVALILAPVYVILILFGWISGMPWYLGGVFSGLIWFIYSFFMESATGMTLGKMLLGLKVTAKEGSFEMNMAMMRNLTKIFWLFIALDILLGMITDAQDFRQRYMDRIAKTVVIVDKKAF